jgi:predicted double-glycine peptidase
VEAEIEERELDWTVLEMTVVRVAGEDAARDLVTSGFIEGAGLAARRRREVVEALPPQLAGAQPDEMRGPFAVDGGYDVIRVDQRLPPSPDDPEMRRRAEAALAERALRSVQERHVVWRTPLPERADETSDADVPADPQRFAPGGGTRRMRQVWQLDEMDCGAACLAMVCRHFGRPVPMSRVREAVATGIDGTSLRGIVVGARRLGLAAQSLKASKGRLDELSLPAVCHLDGYHWVVLHEVGRRSVRFADPAHGPRRMARDEWTSRWTGFCALFVPTPALTELAPARSPWRWLGPFVRPHRGALALAALLALAAAGLQMLVPVGSGLIVDEAAPEQFGCDCGDHIAAQQSLLTRGGIG